MKVLWYEEIESFLKITLDHLKREEALNNLMLGIALRFRNEPDFFEKIHLAAVLNLDKLAIAALMTEPENLIIYGVKGARLQALESLCDSLLQRKLPMPGVVGPKALTEKFVANWQMQAKCSAELERHMRVYELRQVDKTLIGEGRLRSVQESDGDFLLEAIIQFYKETGLDPTPDREMCKRAAREYINSQTAFVWEHEGRAVSLAAQGRDTGSGIAVNLVYTPEHLRKRGYASSCVAALGQQILDAGYDFCTLFTDLVNPTSNKIYMKIGYKPVGDFVSYRFRY